MTIQEVAEETMTIQEVADALGVSKSTIERAIRKHFPNLMQERKTTRLNEGQVAIVRREIDQNKRIGNCIFKDAELTRADIVLKMKEALYHGDKLKGLDFIIKRLKGDKK